VDGFLTVGHPAAVAAVHAMLASRVPHAILISGPGSVGKVALALDLAAGLLCTGATGGGRPCRSCRTCRMVEHGNHPDLHWLLPEGPGAAVLIGGPDSKMRGVRDLVTELSLLPVEGGGRVAIIRDVQRASEDAQSALLKTLEEPLPDTTLILCADDEEVLLPTIRSRCARIRLGVVGVRDVERLLVERGLSDAPTAARLARITGGRAGLAVAYASAEGAEAIRGELTRTLLDLLELRPSRRLAAAKPLLSRAMELDALLSPAAPVEASPRRPGRGKGSPAAQVQTRAGSPGTAAAAAPASDAGEGPDDAEDEAPDDGATKKTPAAPRRRALLLLLDAWRSLARDLAFAQRGAEGSIRDVMLLEEIEAAARDLPAGAPAAMLLRLVRADELIAGNVSPELVLDVLLVRWPRRSRAA
jgi:DNA polymerase-3 subunit delta'